MEQDQAAETLTLIRNQIASLNAVQVSIQNSTSQSSAVADIDDATAALSRAANLLATSSSPHSLRLAQAVAAAAASQASSTMARAQQQLTVSSASTQTALLTQSTAAAGQLARETGQAIFQDHRFDPFLHFASSEEEAAYRADEKTRREFVEAQLQHPGDPIAGLAALEAERDQVQQAIGQGADRSPDAAPMLHRLTTRIEQQRQALQEAGRSPEEIDRDVANTVRQFLVARGVPETEIAQRLAGGNPLAALAGTERTDPSTRVASTKLFTDLYNQADRIAGHSAERLQINKPSSLPLADPSTSSLDAALETVKTGLATPLRFDQHEPTEITKPAGVPGATASQAFR